MFKYLLFCVFSFSLSASENQPDPISTVKAHQDLLNKGHNAAALQYWLPSKRHQLSGMGFSVIEDWFSGVELTDAVFEQSCEPNECVITTLVAKDGEHVNLTYRLKKLDGVFYLSNMQSKNAAK
ncbi:hypothetical protein [Bowmanella denitrificans]|uniref:hypothetical protein n=1 Tax=Bowmanella denitrificans TaxID=366582 RepID=UPI000C9A8B12|nr:hypothetical protein [Bowmanella denitrificans]